MGVLIEDILSGAARNTTISFIMEPQWLQKSDPKTLLLLSPMS